MKKLLPVPAKAQTRAKKQLDEDRVIELAVKRLMKQREATILHYEGLGMAAGGVYAARVSYLRLQYVANSFWPFYEGEPIPSLIFNDPVVGRRLTKAFRADPFMAWQLEAVMNWRTPSFKRFTRINEFGKAFIIGFVEAVENFWNDVSRRIDACESPRQIPIK